MLVLVFVCALQMCEMMQCAIDSIKNTFQVAYAPSEWKKEYLGWDLSAESDRAKASLREGISLKEYQQLLKDLINSAKDYHAEIVFFSTEEAHLPFRVRGVNGKYFVTQVDSGGSLSKGDEIILFGGVPIHQEVLQIRKRELFFGNEETDMRLAEKILTARKGASGHVVPKDEIIITTTTQEHTLSWIYFPEKITPQKVLRSKKKRPFLFTRCDFDDDAKKSFLPPLGQQIWAVEEPFSAYLFETPSKKRIGFIRISTYEGTEKDSEEFGHLMSEFQCDADALIIDQTGNPGGYLFYLYSLIARMIDTPMPTFKHRIAITQKDVMKAITLLMGLDLIRTDEEAQDILGKSWEGLPVDLNLAKSFTSYNRFVVDQWDRGNTIMDLYTLDGIDEVLPSKNTRFTKPILILTDGLDFSCADYFPAMMQDSKRAVIMGTRTAGAGGSVTKTHFPNLLGIAYYVHTDSFAERQDGSPLENLGVTPDIIYNITENDVLNDYQEYAQKIVETIELMVQ